MNSDAFNEVDNHNQYQIRQNDFKFFKRKEFSKKKGQDDKNALSDYQ